MNKNTIIYIDMDDTICEYSLAKKRVLQDYYPDKNPHPFSIAGFYLNLAPIIGAIEAVNDLRKRTDVYILTAPSIRNPNSYSEKRQWIEKYFGFDFCKKLIICPHKGLLKGHILIDDNNYGCGQESFEGLLMQFGTKKYPNWKVVMSEFNTTKEVIFGIS